MLYREIVNYRVVGCLDTTLEILVFFLNQLFLTSENQEFNSGIRYMMFISY